MSLIEVLDEEAIPRLALAGSPPPEGSATIIAWIDLEHWNFLLECKRYTTANPDDIGSKLVYKNLLRAYSSGC